MSNNYDYDLDALESELGLLGDLDYEVGAAGDDLDMALGLSGGAPRSMSLARAPARLSLAAPPRRTLAGGGGSSSGGGSEQLRSVLQALVQHQKAMAAAHKKMAQEIKLQKLSAASTAGEVPQIFLGIDSRQKAQNGIAPGASLVLSVESTEPLRITNLLVDDAIASDFTISRIQVGRLNLLAGSDPVPAAIFKSSVVRAPIATPILPAGTEAKIEVQNRSQAPRDFVAAFTGIDVASR